MFNDDHLNINKRKVPPIKLSRIDWPKAIAKLEEESRRISDVTSHNHVDNETFYLLLSNAIYDTCNKKCYKKEKLKVHYPPHAENCNSKNFKAIAQILSG